MDSSAHKILPVGQGVMIFLQTHQATIAAKHAQAVDHRLKLIAGKAGAAMNLSRRDP